MSEQLAFGRFVDLNEHDTPALLERMSSVDLPVEGDRYGIVTRLIAKPGAEVVDLAAAALQKLFETMSTSPTALGAIVLSSRIYDPNKAASKVAKRLGLDCPAIGIERACSGFPAATELAMRLVKQHQKPVAVVTAEIISRSINWESATGDLSDQRRARGQAAKLFADGAAAVVVGPYGINYPNRILNAWQGEVPDEQELIQKTEVEMAVDPWGNTRSGSTTCISMPGRRGFWLVKRAPAIMLNSIMQTLESACLADLPGDGVLHVVPHQANGLILSRLQKQLDEKLPDAAKVWNCIKHAGNTVSASIPLAMSQVQDRLESQAVVAMPSVGAGGPGYRPNVLSTGCVLLRSEPICSLSHDREYQN